MLTVERLRNVLNYDSATGVFTWKAPINVARIGRVAGSIDGKKYWHIMIDRRMYFAHRLAWLYIVGTWPSGQIDHIDHDRLNNRFENLRDVTHSINQQNQRKAKSNNKLGLLGVRCVRKRFAAEIKIDGKKTHIGTFDTPELAYSAYVAAKRLHHPGNTL